MSMELRLTGKGRLIAFIHIHKLRERSLERLEIRRRQPGHAVELRPRKEMHALHRVVVADRRGYPLAALRDSRLDPRLRPSQRLYAPLKAAFTEMLERLIVPLGHHDILQSKPKPPDQPIVENDKFRTRNVALGKLKLAVHDVADKNRMHHRVRAPVHRKIAKIPELTGKERQRSNAVVAARDRHEMAERPRAEIVLLGDEH